MQQHLVDSTKLTLVTKATSIFFCFYTIKLVYKRRAELGKAIKQQSVLHGNKAIVDFSPVT